METQKQQTETAAPAAGGVQSEEQRHTAMGEAFLKAAGIEVPKGAGVSAPEQPQDEPAAVPQTPQAAADGSPDEPQLSSDERAGQALLDAIEGKSGESGDVDKSTQIDYDLEIPMPDGLEPVKLGDLKDLATDYSRREKALQERETATSAQQQEVGQLLQILGEQVPHHVREHVAAKQQQHIREQSAVLLDLIPGMGDPVERERITTGVMEVAKSLGYLPQEIAQISNARDFRTLHRLWELESRWANAFKTKAEVTATKEPAPRRGKGNNSQQRSAKLEAIVKDPHSPDRYTAMGELLLAGQRAKQ